MDARTLAEQEVRMKTTAGMTISIERYNRLSDIEKAESAVPDGVSVVLVSGLNRIGMIVPNETTIIRLAQALVHVIGGEGQIHAIREIRDVRGVLMEYSRTIGQITEFDKTPFAKFFVTFTSEQQKESQWVNITDDPGTLPEWDGIKNYVHVRVYGPKIEVMCAPADAYFWHQHDAIYDGKDFWIGDTQVTEAVTHWQPIPSPPKADSSPKKVVAE